VLGVFKPLPYFIC